MSLTFTDSPRIASGLPPQESQWKFRLLFSIIELLIVFALPMAIAWGYDYSGRWWGVTGFLYQVGSPTSGYHFTELYYMWSTWGLYILGGATTGFIMLGCILAPVSCGKAKFREAKGQPIGIGPRNALKASIGFQSSGSIILLGYSLGNLLIAEELSLLPFFILPLTAYQIYLFRGNSKRTKDPWNIWLLLSIIEVAVLFALPYLISWRYDVLRGYAVFYSFSPGNFLGSPTGGLGFLMMNIVEIGALGMFAGPVMGIVTSIVTKHRTQGGAPIGAGTRNTAKIGIIFQLGAGVFLLVALFGYLFDSYSSMNMVILYPLAILPISLWHVYFTFEHPKFKATDFQRDRLKSGMEISASSSRPPEPTQTKYPVPKSIVTTPPPPPSNIRICPACNASLPVNAKFCNKCGKIL